MRALPQNKLKEDAVDCSATDAKPDAANEEETTKPFELEKSLKNEPRLKGTLCEEDELKKENDRQKEQNKESPWTFQ
jgi:hypothetical protein